MTEKLDLETKKEIAKLGMATSLGITVLSALFLKHNKTMKQVHTGAGVALAGFSLWHHLLYQPSKKPVKAEAEPVKS
ncbi:MAG: hypothetical protein CSB24_00055 [Deltaproteobacteria bacterium]|nr:MAG: hypothetical protein CSB24_00055 [Deltaproteobacteria bacterium]